MLSRKSICYIFVLLLLYNKASAQFYYDNIRGPLNYRTVNAIGIQSIFEEMLQKGDFEEANAFATLAIIRYPGLPLHYENRGSLRGNLLGDPKAGIGDLNRSISLGGGTAFVYQTRGQFYAKLGNYDQALADVTTAIEKNGNIIHFRHVRMAICYSLGKQESLIGDARFCLDKNPADNTAIVFLGVYYSAKSETESALSCFNKAIALDAEDYSAYYHRGILRAKMGDFEKAYSDFCAVIDLHCTFGEQITC